MARARDRQSSGEKHESRSTWSEFLPNQSVARNVLIVGIAVIVFWMFLGGWVTSFFSSATTNQQSGSAQQMSAVLRCRPAPAAFLNGASELRFRKERGVKCFEFELPGEWSSFIYPPLEYVTLELPIEPITPGIIEVRMKDGKEFKITVDEGDLLDRRKLPRILFGLRCMVFQLKGTAKVQVTVDRFERLDPNGVENSTQCPGMN